MNFDGSNVSLLHQQVHEDFDKEVKESLVDTDFDDGLSDVAEDVNHVEPPAEVSFSNIYYVGQSRYLNSLKTQKINNSMGQSRKTKSNNTTTTSMPKYSLQAASLWHQVHKKLKLPQDTAQDKVRPFHNSLPYITFPQRNMPLGCSMVTKGLSTT